MIPNSLVSCAIGLERIGIMPKIGTMHSGKQGRHDVDLKAFEDCATASYNALRSAGPALTFSRSYAGDDPTQLPTKATDLQNDTNVTLIGAAGGGRLLLMLHLPTAQKT